MDNKETPKVEVLTLRDVIKLLNISTATGVRWLREGRFIGVSRIGSQWIFSKDFQVKEDKRGLSKELLKRLA